MNKLTNRWLVLAIVSTALLLIVVDMTVLYTALPRLTHDLGATGAQKLWIVNAYALAVAGLLPGAGTLGDRVGAKRMFLAGLAIFGVASLAAAFAPTAAALIAARVLLAVGAAAMMPATLAIIRHTFESADERALAIGIWAAVASGGAALGPVLGGVLLAHFGWGSVFLINVPIVLLALPLAAWLIEARPGDASRHWDVRASLYLLGTLVALAFAIKTAGQRAPSWAVMALALGVGLACAALFVRRQRRAASPLIDFTLFAEPRFAGGVAAALVAALALVGLELVLAQRLQLVAGLTPLDAALVILPVPLAAFVAGPLAGLALRRMAALPLMALALLVAAMGTLGVAATHAALGAPLLAWLAVVGAGLGAVMTGASSSIMHHAPPERAGMAASVEEVSYELGGALGVALLGSVLGGVYAARLVPPAGVPATARDSLDEALLAAQTLPPALAQQLTSLAQTAFDQAFGVVALVTAALLLAVAALTWVMGQPTTRHANQTKRLPWTRLCRSMDADS